MKYKLNKKLSDKSLDQLRKYHWPGNIRELKNVIERLTILSDHQIITDLNVREVLLVNNVGDGVFVGGTAHQHLQGKMINKGAILYEYESYEQAKILDALKQVNGSKTKAARILGMTRTRLYRKLNK